jgi:hypothetical protein
MEDIPILRNCLNLEDMTTRSFLGFGDNPMRSDFEKKKKLRYWVN